MLGASPRPASIDRMKPAGRCIHTPHFDVEWANIWTIFEVALRREHRCRVDQSSFPEAALRSH